MANSDKINLNLDTMKKIKSGLTNIKLLSNDKYVKKEAEELIKIIDSELTLGEMSLEEMIHERMKEVKNSDPTLSADLYILYRKLVDGKISEREALELFESCVQMEPFDKKIY